MSETLSVVMPVRNALPHLDAAVRSILDQSFSDFEFLIEDDGSTDGSAERLREWALSDERIRLFETGAARPGPVAVSARVAARARGSLVARMDADDISRADRFERQVAALRARPDAAMVGSLWIGIDDEGRQVHGRDRSTLAVPGRAPFLHGTIMYRRAAFERAGGYREGTDYFEDGDLYRRMRGQGAILVVPEPLYRYRWSTRSSAIINPAAEAGLNLGARALAGAAIADEARLAALRAEGAEGRIAPDVYIGLGYRFIWSGRRPRTLRRFLARADFTPRRLAVRALAWTIGASVAPRALRRVMRKRLEMRDRAAGAAIRDGQLYEWTGVSPPRWRAD